MRTESEQTREQAWRSFYREHFDALYRLVCCLGASSAEAEDLTQQVFVVVHRKIMAGGDIQYPKAWVRGIAVRVVSDHRKWRNVRKVKQGLLESTSNAQRSGPLTPEEFNSSAQIQT